MYETWARLCMAGICVFTILTALCAYGWNHFNMKIKQQEKAASAATKSDTTTKPQAVYHIQGDMVQKKVVVEKAKQPKIYAPNAAIVTVDQSGGSNTVNQYYNAKNPKDLVAEPIFNVDGIYGKNILAKDNSNFFINVKQYSLAAQKPEKSVLKIIISVLDKENSIMGFRMGTGKGWISNIEKGYFEFTLPVGEISGDYDLGFQRAGSASVQYFLDGTKLMEKEIHWQ